MNNYQNPGTWVLICKYSELSNEYQHDRVWMFFKNLSVLVLRTKFVSALEGLSFIFIIILSSFSLYSHCLLLLLLLLLLFVADTVSQKLKNNNVFTIAKRKVEGQDMLYMSLKLTNGIWVLAELKIQPGNSSFIVSTPSSTFFI